MSTISFTVTAPTWAYYVVSALMVISAAFNLWAAIEMRKLRKAGIVR